MQRNCMRQTHATTRRRITRTGLCEARPVMRRAEPSASEEQTPKARKEQTPMGAGKLPCNAVWFRMSRFKG